MAATVPTTLAAALLRLPARPGTASLACGFQMDGTPPRMSNEHLWRDAARVEPLALAEPCRLTWVCYGGGSTIGCAECNGIHGHTNVSLCADPKARPMLNDSHLRTMNVKARAGSAEDVYMWNPWRAPGTAPVKDACGMAGGSWNVTPGDATVFATTKFARQGDHGSTVLKPGPSVATWAAGSVVEVAWAIRYNHGGGCAGSLPTRAARPFVAMCLRSRCLALL